MTTTTTRTAAQRRTLATLSLVQVVGGVGFSAGLAVGTLLAENVSGRTELAGLGGTFQVIGGALLAIPIARRTARLGRGPGLVLGYALAILGALGLIAAAVIGSFPLLLAASVLFGGATASNSQTPYAAADLARPEHRGRDLSLVVWATTVGSVLGPNLVGLAGPVSDLLHLPLLAGPYAISVLGFVVAIAVLRLRLRPDPLLEARRLAAESANDNASADETPVHGSVARGLGFVARHTGARLGLVTQALGHAVMVSVMLMTPVHLREGHVGLEVIGLVISIHIVGMFAFSPLVGIAVDRFGSRRVALAGAGILAMATVLASRAHSGASADLMLALFLLGVGWSCTFVAGSTLLTNATPASERPGVQGASALAMGLAGGGGGALAGWVVGVSSYATLALASFAIAVVIGVLLLADLARSPRGTASGDTPSG